METVSKLARYYVPHKRRDNLNTSRHWRDEMKPLILAIALCGANERGRDVGDVYREKAVEVFACIELNHYSPISSQWIFWEVEKQRDGSYEWHVAAWRIGRECHKYTVDELGWIHFEFEDFYGVYRVVEGPLRVSSTTWDREVAERSRRPQEKRTGLRGEKQPFIGDVFPTE